MLPTLIVVEATRGTRPNDGSHPGDGDTPADGRWW